VEVAASGISSTQAKNPTVMNGRLMMSSMIADRSKNCSTPKYTATCSVAYRKAKSPSSRRTPMIGFQPESLRIGETASVASSSTSAQ
jgi:hypothetical protein